MQYADLTTASFRGSDFRRANLENASLRDTDLNGSNLGSSDLRETDLSRADLRNCDLQSIDWERITNINLANVFGVREARTGFVQWAVGHGAVLVESDPDWFE